MNFYIKSRTSIPSGGEVIGSGDRTTFKGWKSKTQGVRNMKDLPENAKKYIYALEDFIGAKISSVSTSPERDDTILIEDPFKY